MKKLLFFLFLAITLSVKAQTGNETIDYTTSTGDKGSFTVSQLRGAQGSVTSVTGSGSGGATVTVTNSTTAPHLNVSLANIPNAALTNSGFMLNGTTVALGGTHTLQLGSIGGVTLTAPTANQAMYYNGTAWVNGALPTAALANPTVAVTLGTAGTDINSSSMFTLGGGFGINIPVASPTASGKVIAGPQDFGGNKGFVGVLCAKGGWAAKSATVSATGTEALTQTYVKCNAGATDITRTLPANPVDGFVITYKRVNSTAGNTIIVPNASQTLSGGTQVRLVSLNRTVTFQYDQATAVWEIID